MFSLGIKLRSGQYIVLSKKLVNGGTDMAKVVIHKGNEGQKLKLVLNKLPVTWLDAFIPNIRLIIEKGFALELAEIEEIRLRVNRPLLIRIGQNEFTVNREGTKTAKLDEGYIVTTLDLEQTIQVLSQNSLYAWEDEFRNGYITIPGGHRIGLVGRGVLDKGQIKTIKEISGLNYRIGKEILGCADPIIPYIIQENRVLQTLIISPPQCGKTTLLRDIVRQLSDGIKRFKFAGVNVGLVDERSEIAGTFLGQPQFKIGLRTDVLDACPKAQGMIMLIRSMSPAVIATDEIGRMEDVNALYQALQAGVSVITTVHGYGFQEIQERPVIQELIQGKYFDRFIVLSRKWGVGTIEAIYNGKNLERMR